MNDDVRKEAEKRVNAKMGFYISAVTFLFVSVVLVLLSFFMPSISFWLLLPLPIFAMVLGILYITTFGYNFSSPPSTDWKEREMEKEMYRLSQRQDIAPLEDLSEEDRLELKELDRLQRKWGPRDDEFV